MYVLWLNAVLKAVWYVQSTHIQVWNFFLLLFAYYVASCCGELEVETVPVEFCNFEILWLLWILLQKLHQSYLCNGLLEVQHPISGTSVKKCNSIFLLDANFSILGNASWVFVRGTFSFLSGELYGKLWVQDRVARVLHYVALKDVKLLQTHSLSQFSFPACVETGILMIFLLLFVHEFSFPLTYLVCGFVPRC